MDYIDLDEKGTSLNMLSKWSLKEVKPGMKQLKILFSQRKTN